VARVWRCRWRFGEAKEVEIYDGYFGKTFAQLLTQTEPKQRMGLDNDDGTHLLFPRHRYGGDAAPSLQACFIWTSAHHRLIAESDFSIACYLGMALPSGG